MDEARFDRWTRSLPTRRGRRALLAAIAGGAVGLLGRAAPTAAADIPRGTCLLPSRACRAAGQCCSLECRGRRCGCAEIGDSCLADAGCCWGYCRNVDNRRAFCTCSIEGQRCASFRECCSGTCDRRGRCTCSKLGQSCSLGTHCCSSLVCRGGRCARP